jgi:hypothetical protein
MIVPSESIRMRLTDDGVPYIRIADAPVPSELASELDGLGVRLSDDSTADLPLRPWAEAHRNIAKRLGIPKKYYDRMRDDAPGLLTQNVNTWLVEANRNYFVRTFRPIEEDGSRGIMRAMLSDRYKVIDHYDLLLSVLNAVKGLNVDVRVDRTNLNRRSMYVTFRAPDVQIPAERLLRSYRNPATRRGGDVNLTAGFVLSNSEIGRGSFQIKPRPIANVCLNAFTWKPHKLRKVHAGAQLDEGAIEWSDDTRRHAIDLAASQVRDAVTRFCTPEYLEDLVAEMLDESGADRELDHPITATKNIASYVGLNEEEQEEVLTYFMRSGDSRAIGAAQAVTFFAHEAEDADKQFEVEEQFADVLANLDTFDVAEEIA